MFCSLTIVFNVLQVDLLCVYRCVASGVDGQWYRLFSHRVQGKDRISLGTKSFPKEPEWSALHIGMFVFCNCIITLFLVVLLS